MAFAGEMSPEKDNYHINSTPYRVGVVPGKFLPPHRGHLRAIINAATRCKKVYVVVSDHPELTKQLCEESGLPVIDLKLRTKWLARELQGFDHIKVLMLDETGIAMYPYGWQEWSQRLKNLIPEEFDALFGGEPEYAEFNKIYFPEVNYELFDYKRERYPVSATEIRNDPLKHWDYILGSARNFFAKKVLITGTESCGKTTITKYLGKIYHTSWSEEEGRYYSQRHLGGNEALFTIEDFGKIAFQQHETDIAALKAANKVVFFDSDAVATKYYAELYLGETSDIVDSFIAPSRYDLVLLFSPDVEWVNDGLRWNNETRLRWQLHEKLKQMYIDHGFGSKMIEINGDYSERLRKCMSIVDSLLLHLE